TRTSATLSSTGRQLASWANAASSLSKSIDKQLGPARAVRHWRGARSGSVGSVCGVSAGGGGYEPLDLLTTIKLPSARERSRSNITIGTPNSLPRHSAQNLCVARAIAFIKSVERG